MLLHQKNVIAQFSFHTSTLAQMAVDWCQLSPNMLDVNKILKCNYVCLCLAVQYFITIKMLFSHVGVEVMRQLITSFIFSRLDYCNTLLVNLPISTIAPSQRVQNDAARLLLGLPRRDHVRPALKELHWLPVVFRIKFKVALTHTHTHAAAQTTSPIQCRHVTVIWDRLDSALRPVLTILFHGQERNSATEPSLWPDQLYGTVYQQ